MTSHSEARERVLDAAEKLFVERGYKAVTVKDIAKLAGIHHASLYHHIPDGKSALYVEVMTRHMERHSHEMRVAIQQGQGDLRKELQQIAAWLLSQPPIDVVRLATSDLPAINDVAANTISDLAFEATVVPIVQVLEAARRRGEIKHPHLGNIAGAIFSSIEGVHSIPGVYVNRSRQFMANELIDVFLRGLQTE
ncbi:MAG: TetR/AcrR family transcriptional regulator [Chloroflexota bacterium]